MDRVLYKKKMIVIKYFVKEKKFVLIYLYGYGKFCLVFVLVVFYEIVFVLFVLIFFRDDLVRLVMFRFFVNLEVFFKSIVLLLVLILKLFFQFFNNVEFMFKDFGFYIVFLVNNLVYLRKVLLIGKKVFLILCYFFVVLELIQGNGKIVLDFRILVFLEDVRLIFIIRVKWFIFLILFLGYFKVFSSFVGYLYVYGRY